MTSCPSARDRWLLCASMSTAQDATRLDAGQAALFAGVCSALPQRRRSRTSEMLAAAPHAARSPQVHARPPATVVHSLALFRRPPAAPHCSVPAPTRRVCCASAHAHSLCIPPLTCSDPPLPRAMHRR